MEFGTALYLIIVSILLLTAGSLVSASLILYHVFIKSED